MSVMECQKKGCENLMCHLYNEDFGYLCWECFNDLAAYCEYKNDYSDATIREFMKISKPDLSRTNHSAIWDQLREKFR